MISAEERTRLKQKIDHLSDELCEQSDPALASLVDYFREQIYDSMWNKVETWIYDLSSSKDTSKKSNASVTDNLKSLMATLIVLDASSLAEQCRK